MYLKKFDCMTAVASVAVTILVHIFIFCYSCGKKSNIQKYQTSPTTGPAAQYFGKDGQGDKIENKFKFTFDIDARFALIKIYNFFALLQIYDVARALITIQFFELPM